MEHYVTLFDCMFLPQGLALHLSMERHLADYNLWIICVDDVVYKSLSVLNLANVKLLQLSALETDELLRVKSARSRGEYCWTLTPFAPRFVFDADSTVRRVTYIDADMWFTKNPKPIFDEFELSGKSVLITDHAYAPEYDQSATSGRFCVQFMIFCRGKSERVRGWWEKRCVEWCFARFEDGKFGDQKYLDDWPERFSQYVHVLKQQDLVLAPWNASRFPYSTCVVFHFHGFKISSERLYMNECYYLPRVLVLNLIKFYVSDIRSALLLMRSFNIKQCEWKKKCGLVSTFMYILFSIRRVVSLVFYRRSVRIFDSN